MNRPFWLKRVSQACSLALLCSYSATAKTESELGRVTVTGTCYTCVDLDTYYLSGQHMYLGAEAMLSTTMDADGGSAALERKPAKPNQDAINEVIKGIDPPCPKPGESAASYQARATKYCVGVVKSAFPILTETLAATSCTAMNPKISEAWQGIGYCKG